MTVMQNYEMTVTRLADAYMDELNLENVYNLTVKEVWYVSGNKIYMAADWDGSFESSAYTLKNGVLIIEEDVLKKAARRCNGNAHNQEQPAPKR